MGGGLGFSGEREREHGKESEKYILAGQASFRQRIRGLERFFSGTFFHTKVSYLLLLGGKSKNPLSYYFHSPPPPGLPPTSMQPPTTSSSTPTFLPKPLLSPPSPNDSNPLILFSEKGAKKPLILRIAEKIGLSF